MLPQGVPSANYCKQYVTPGTPCHLLRRTQASPLAARPQGQGASSLRNLAQHPR